MIRAVSEGLCTLTGFPSDGTLVVFLPNQALSLFLFNLGCHQYLPEASSITASLSDFVSGPDTSVAF